MPGALKFGQIKEMFVWDREAITNTVPIHNKHISVRPKKSAYYGKCAYFGKCDNFGKCAHYRKCAYFGCAYYELGQYPQLPSS